MNQSNPHFGTPGRSLPAEDERVIDLSSLFGIAWRGKWLLLVATLVAFFLGAFYVYRIAVPLYTAKAVVMLENREAQVLDLDSVMAGLGTDSTTIYSEVEVLRSRNLLGKVVNALNLIEDPEFNSALREPSLRSKLSTRLGNLIGEDQDQAKTVAGNAVIEASEARRTQDRLINTLLSKSQIRNMPQSLVFEIAVTTQSPEKSATIADAIARFYIQDQLDAKFEATEQATAWLTNRVSELQGELESAESRVKAFNSSTDLVSEDALAALDRQIKDLRDRIQSTLLTRDEIRLRLERLNAAETPTEKAAAVPARMQLSQLLDQIGTPEGARAFDQRFQQILTQARQELQRAETQLEALQESETTLSAQFERQSSDLIELQQLSREAEASRLLYEYFLSRLKETAAQQGVQQADSRILSQAQIPINPSEPRKSFILAISGIFGLLIGTAGLLLFEARNNTFRTAREIEVETQYQVMGQIPVLPARRRRDAIAYLAERPTSVSAEAIRNLRTSLLLSDVDHPPQVTMVTSSYPGDGKTTVSLALAQNLSGMGKRVLLIEGDIRRRIFSQYLGAEQTRGLVSVIAGEAEFSDVVMPEQPPIGSDVLIGEKTAINAADLFASTRFATFIAAMRQQYDHIVIDTPPALVVPDARVLAQNCDSVLFVVKWNRTPRPHVAEALRMFESVNAPVSGIVLNQINPRGMRRYGQYGYGAYSSYGYARKYYNN
ncbi:polysaccharide biosynthesis tyrosine autokinase [Oceanicola sp. S124]|uniref:polysaccharide biosynthesis tyrosine autokinase n=1 Tax=Oceanicola sp. S124 TaxID=1042378 RepID=UPI00025599BE|nr:polysaccharide biosynthesis tyrosine autokinase [Oceanicola sp. S124]